MSDPGPRFCPRCGTARVRDMPFCPQCGLNMTEVHGDQGSALEASPSDTAPPEQTDAAPQPVAGRLALPAISGTRVPPIAIFAGIVILGLFVLGLLPRLQLGGTASQSAAPPSFGFASGAPAAPIVGLTILSPTDGQAVATKDVVVIGIAPPGLTITQDVSFGLDNHTKADGTGHWAMNVGLGNGDNKLTFRIGDDKSTSKTIRVIYTPPPGG